MKRNKRNKVEDAKMLAVRMHGLQEYDNFPYHKHLQDVVDVLIEFGYTHEDQLCAGYLHDVLEDTPLNYNDIAGTFGLDVAEMVYGVTDELGRSRQERKEKTLPKTRSIPTCIPIKLADRVANMRNSIAGNHSMANKYAKEYSHFKKSLQIEGEDEGLWRCLDKLNEPETPTKLLIDKIVEEEPRPSRSDL